MKKHMIQCVGIFFYYMLGRLRFWDKWIRLIKACLKSASMSILVNRSPTKEFKFGKGHRQGPLLLFYS